MGLEKNPGIQKTPFQLVEELEQSLLKDATQATTLPVLADLKQLLLELNATQSNLSQQNAQLLNLMTLTQKVEDSLRVSEERYRSLFENAPTGISHIAIDGRYLFVNRRFCEIVGYSEQELSQRRFQQISHPDDLAAQERFLARLLSGEISSGSMEKRYFHKSGAIIWTHLMISLVRDTAGEPLYFISVIEDISEKRLAQEALKETETRFREVLENTIDASYRRDRLTNTYDYFSPTVFPITGYSSDEMMQLTLENFLQMIHPDDQNLVTQNIQSAQVNTASPYHSEFRLRCKDGSYRWISDSFRLVPDENGQARYIVGSVRDISARRQAEADLRASEKKYRQLFENMTSGFALHEMVYDEQGRPVDYRYLEVNPAFERLTGLTASQVIGKGVREILPGLEQGWLATYARVAETGIPAKYTDFAAGLGRYYEAWAFCPQQGQFAVVFEDITEQVRAQQSLGRSEEMFRQLAETMQEVFWVGDYKSRQVEYVNPAYERIWGRPQQSLYESPEAFTESVVAEDRQRVTEAFYNQADGRLFNQEYRIMRPDGTLRWVASRTYPVWGPDDNIQRLVGIVEDITERKQAQLALSALNAELEHRVYQRTEQLQSSNKSLDAFSYSVSHDLRAPLRVINGFGKMLKEDYAGNLGEQGNRYIDKVLGAADRMGQLIDDLLKLSQINRKTTNFGPVDLSGLVREISKSLAETDPGRRVEWVIAPGITVFGYENLLRVAFENLLSNAWKFTSSRAAGQIEFGQEIENKQTVYWFRDNGIGFDALRAQGLFEPFHRYHSDSEFEGTGIGLAIVKRIIDHHGGTIWAKSEIGSGATFYFTLPTR